MTSRKPEIVFFDSNVHINLLRSSDYERGLERFLQGACLYAISKIVLMELWAGAKSKHEENILKLYEKNLPLIGFSDDGFILAGQLMQKMARDSNVEPRARRRLAGDILIALCARENNALLVTENEADFKKIQRHVGFEFISA